MQPDDDEEEGVESQNTAASGLEVDLEPFKLKAFRNENILSEKT